MENVYVEWVVDIDLLFVCVILVYYILSLNSMNCFLSLLIVIVFNIVLYWVIIWMVWEVCIIVMDV